jgi:lipid-binding SYLF domain-containing protein
MNFNKIRIKMKNSKTIESLKLKKMKKNIINLAILVLTITGQVSIAQTRESHSEFIKESKEELAKMIEKSPNLQSYYDQSYGYAVFPKVTKVGISLGGAAGKGIVFQNHSAICISKLKQLTVGSQFGAQKYTEIIFFQNEEALEQFMNNKLKFNGQASAVALKKGASADLSYSYGVAVFTQAIGGLMFEASIGGQHFANQPIED